MFPCAKCSKNRRQLCIRPLTHLVQINQDFYCLGFLKILFCNVHTRNRYITCKSRSVPRYLFYSTRVRMHSLSVSTFFDSFESGHIGILSRIAFESKNFLDNNLMSKRQSNDVTFQNTSKGLIL